MKLISHRGNINGPNILENNPNYIDDTLNICYDVEIDIWLIDNQIYLGHDKPTYKIEMNWLVDRIDMLWIHCKNTEILELLNECEHKFNYFWHENDTVTLTSHGFMWAYPGKQSIKNSIAVLPEIYNDDVSKCYGICSDYISNYQ